MPMKLPGVVAEYLSKEFGGYFSYATMVASIGTSQSQLLNNDPERVFILVTNLSVNNVVISPAPVVTLTTGQFLSPNGGSTSSNLRDDFVFPSMPLQAIASGASSSVFVLTIRRYLPTTSGDNNDG